jgi:hypothetical protein
MTRCFSIERRLQSCSRCPRAAGWRRAERFVFEISSRILAGRVAQNSPTVALPTGLPKLGRNSIRVAAQNSIRKILVFLHADEIIQRMNTQSPRASF